MRYSGHSTLKQRNKNLGYGAGVLVEYLPSIQGSLGLIPSTTFIGSGNTHRPVITVLGKQKGQMFKVLGH